MSQSAISRPAIPIQIAPPISRALPAFAISLNRFSVSKGFFPMRDGANSVSITVFVILGCLLKHSPIPVIPSSV